MLVVGVLVFFVVWAAVAAHPWAPRRGAGSRIAALAARQHQVHAESIRVKSIVDARWAVYRRRSRRTSAVRGAVGRRRARRSAVVNLPPLVVTRTS